MIIMTTDKKGHHQKDTLTYEWHSSFAFLCVESQLFFFVRLFLTGNVNEDELSIQYGNNH
jgi:hypothetical protein